MDKLNDVPARVIAEVVTSNVGRELSSLRLLGLSAQPNSSNVKIIKTLAEAFRELEQRAEAAEAKLAQREKLDEEAMHCATILEFIGSFESDDIDGDFVDLRFEIDGEDVGCDVSITEYARMSAKAIRAIISGASVSLPAPAALPVKLSRITQTGYTHDEITAMCNVRNDDVAAIRAAGYEVEE